MPLSDGQQWIDDNFSANQTAVFITQGDFSSGLSPYCGTHWTTPDKVIIKIIQLIVILIAMYAYCSAHYATCTKQRIAIDMTSS